MKQLGHAAAKRDGALGLSDIRSVGQYIPGTVCKELKR
jgi:hypothetical protein